jgi:hypothetical protein
MVFELVHEFHMDSNRILWLLNTNLIQEDINHMDRNILGNCMLYCDELFLTLILGLSVKEVGPRAPISALYNRKKMKDIRILMTSSVNYNIRKQAKMFKMKEIWLKI